MQAAHRWRHGVIEAHNKAVRAAVALMEKHVNVRKKVWGRSHREQTGNLVAAAFQHECRAPRTPSYTRTSS